MKPIRTLARSIVRYLNGTTTKSLQCPDRTTIPSLETLQTRELLAADLGAGALDNPPDHAIMTTSEGVDFVRTAEEYFESLPDWPYEANYMEIDGLRQAYVDEGPEDGPVVLLLHGQPSWSYLYREMIPVLADAGYRVIAMDHLGMGRSDKPIDIEYYSYLNHSDRLEQFIEELDLQDINLFAQDWGSLIGLRVAGLHPDWFASITIGNGFLPVFPEGFQPFPEVENPDEIVPIPSPFTAIPPQQVPFYHGCDSLTGREDNSYFGNWMNYAMKAESFQPSEVVEALTWFDLPPEEEAAYDAPFPSRTYMAGVRSFPSLINDLPGQNDEAWAGLTSFEKPFLTIWATNDPGAQGSCEAQHLLIDNVPGAKGQPHVRLDEASHFLQDDQGEEIARRLVEFYTAPSQPSPEPLWSVDPTTMTWYLQSPNTSGAPQVTSFAYGAVGWYPVVGDWDGNLSSTTIGAVDATGRLDPSNLVWHMRNSNTPGAADHLYVFGLRDWQPLAGDWSGNGASTAAVVDDTGANSPYALWYFRDGNSIDGTLQTVYAFGLPGWIPVAGDWNGDGIDTAGMFNPSTGLWYLRNSNSPFDPGVTVVQFGVPGMRPVVGDWDGDGLDTVGVVDINGFWYPKHSNAGTQLLLPEWRYGLGGWVPLTGNWELPSARNEVRVGYEIVQVVSPNEIITWANIDGITQEEFDANVLPPGWLKNQPREIVMDGAAFVSSPGVAPGEFVEGELFGHSWRHVATVVNANVPLDDDALLTANTIAKSHQVTFNADSTLSILVSPEEEHYVLITRDAGRTSDTPTIPEGWQLVEYTLTEELVVQLPNPTLNIRTDNEDSYQGPVPQLAALINQD